ncbi:hydrogenase maturation nickel metallochaperone HypA [Maridesulfovibrio hydrothermalis]|uniref:Hydrogenase maturation factor HypA n=1 Tax=Maridesulfovibrio hydrothermalis AM13 = DSM 14728 TaxID=1121451 RepID=L0R8L9_9BACT|nr:hydrogenase maturation nickel metallochaperone HypA [Maridesulfovibrio hydrothermalis]CCO22572.1 putative hydrogenase nickel incorporation protein hypA 1 [Maridesulfovibrio hydrothermalis AM13 = DSM 14728]
MHEMSIAQSILAIIQEEMEKQPGATLKKIVVGNGALAGIVSDALIFGWEAVTLGTPLEGSVLEVNEIPIKVCCGGCQKEFIPEDKLYMACPDCGLEIGHKVLQGKELQIESIEIDK